MSNHMALSIGIVLAAVLFLCGWLVSRRIDNYSIVDAIWAFGIGLVSLFWLGVMGNLTMKHWIAAALITTWSLRLGNHLQRRIRKGYPEEDSRYKKLRELWSKRVASAFFWFFQAQALSVILLALPFFLIAADRDTIWSGWETIGLVVALIGLIGEAISDAQMSSFKSKNPDFRSVCQVGLWRYSRHPNYFFEAVIWTGFYVYACGSEFGWATIHAPAIIIYLLLKVTGIPPTEASALSRKGDAYRRYQKTTSAFIPLAPKSISK